MRQRRRDAGQALFELGITLPILMALVMGVIQLGYVLFQTLLVSSIAREGSNLVSRQVTISDTEMALQAMSGIVKFDSNSAVIISVLKLGMSGTNKDQPIISQRHTLGSFSANSVLGDPPQSSYDIAPDYNALDADNDGSIVVTGALPNGLTLTAGESVYVTEVFTRTTSIVPFMPLPDTLYASAFF
jgi:TadE-like protein